VFGGNQGSYKGTSTRTGTNAQNIKEVSGGRFFCRRRPAGLKRLPRKLGGLQKEGFLEDTTLIGQKRGVSG